MPLEIPDLWKSYKPNLLRLGCAWWVGYVFIYLGKEVKGKKKARQKKKKNQRSVTSDSKVHPRSLTGHIMWHVLSPCLYKAEHKTRGHASTKAA